jgi:hypothetical protein
VRRKSSKLLRHLCGNSRSSLLDGLVLDYVHNLLVGLPIERAGIEPERTESLASNGLVIKILEREHAVTGEASRAISRARRRRVLTEYMENASGELRSPHCTAEPFGTNLCWLADSIGLDAVERVALQFLLLLEGHRRLNGLMEYWGELTTHAAIELIAVACALPAEEAHRALAPQSRLRESRLVMLDAEITTMGMKLDC